jgi:hypothetical protein
LDSVATLLILGPPMTWRRVQGRRFYREAGAGVDMLAPGDDGAWAPAMTGAVGQALIFVGYWRRAKDVLLKSPETYFG